MSKIYTIAFRMGVLFNVLLFTILNVASYKIAVIESEKIHSEIMFSPCCRFSWGFPFGWEEKLFDVIEGGGAILNVLIAVFCGFMFGFLFKFVWSKISSPNTELK